jgi:hypothetical protein
MLAGGKFQQPFYFSCTGMLNPSHYILFEQILFELKKMPWKMRH